MWTCSLNDAHEPFRPAHIHAVKILMHANITHSHASKRNSVFSVCKCVKRNVKKIATPANEKKMKNQTAHLAFFTRHPLSNASQTTVCFSMAFFKCLFICSYARIILHIVQTNSVLCNPIRIDITWEWVRWVCEFGGCCDCNVWFYFRYDACVTAESQINQYEGK